MNKIILLLIICELFNVYVQTEAKSHKHRKATASVVSLDTIFADKDNSSEAAPVKPHRTTTTTTTEDSFNSNEKTTEKPKLTGHTTKKPKAKKHKNKSAKKDEQQKLTVVEDDNQPGDYDGLEFQDDKDSKSDEAITRRTIHKTKRPTTKPPKENTRVGHKTKKKETETPIIPELRAKAKRKRRRTTTTKTTTTTVTPSFQSVENEYKNVEKEYKDLQEEFKKIKVRYTTTTTKKPKLSNDEKMRKILVDGTDGSSGVHDSSADDGTPMLRGRQSHEDEEELQYELDEMNLHASPWLKKK